MQEARRQRESEGTRPLLKRALPWAAALLLGWAPLAAPQAAPAATEHEIKAAFLLNFAKFVEWPASAHPAADSPIRVGVLGDDPFGNVLDRTLKGRSVQGRSFVVERSKDPETLKSCHILFVAASEKEWVKPILGALKGLPILTVGEAAGFAHARGVVNFVLQEKLVRFEINPDAAARAGLKVSSKLLQLARIVQEEKP